MSSPKTCNPPQTIDLLETECRFSVAKTGSRGGASSVDQARTPVGAVDCCWGYRSLAAGHLNRVTFDPHQCGGRPCLRGMRIRVSDVLDLLSSGASFDEILQDYPYLEREDILASIEYAARQADHAVLLSA